MFSPLLQVLHHTCRRMVLVDAGERKSPRSGQSAPYSILPPGRVRTRLLTVYSFRDIVGSVGRSLSEKSHSKMLLLLMLPSACMAVWWSPVVNSTLARVGQDFDPTAIEGFTRSVELFEQMETALQSLVGPDAQERGFGLVSANTVYNNLASSSTVLKVIIINICQLFFNSVGWYLVSWVWSILRQAVRLILFQTNLRTGSVSWDPDFQGAFTSQALLNSEFAANNLTGAAGSVRRRFHLQHLFTILSRCFSPSCFGPPS